MHLSNKYLLITTNIVRHDFSAWDVSANNRQRGGNISFPFGAFLIMGRKAINITRKIFGVLKGI